MLYLFLTRSFLSCSEPCTTGLDCNSDSTPLQLSMFLGSSLSSADAAVNTPDQTIVGVSGLGRNWSLGVGSDIIMGLPELGVAIAFPYTQEQFQNENIIQSGTSAQSFGQSVSFLNSENNTYTIISAPDYSTPLWKQGATFVYQDRNSTPITTIFGNRNHEMFGDRVYSCGDIDGDGMEDALVSSSFFGGSLNNDEENQALSGRVYVLNSRQFLQSPEHNATDFVYFTGTSNGGRLGHEANCRSDVSGNGAIDLVISAPFADSGTLDASGAIYILPSDSTSIEEATFRLQGQTSNSWLGWSVGVGDLDGDKLIDVVGGAPGENNSLGAVYVWKGSDLIQGQTSPTIEFRSVETRIGEKVHVADINGDALDDIIIGERSGSLISETQNFSNTGIVHIIFGRTDLAELDGIQTVQEADLQLSINQEEAGFGSTIFSGDLDQDDIQDLLFIHNAAPQ